MTTSDVQRKLEREDPWTVSEDRFPHEGTLEEKLRFVLGYAILAPSNYNSQPWLFNISGGEIALYADRRRGLAVIDPDDREMLISCGAALYNLRVAIGRFGFDPVVETFPDMTDPDLLAFARFGQPSAPSDETIHLFDAIRRRRTNRLEMEDRVVAPDVILRLQKAAEEEGAALLPVDDSSKRDALGELVAWAIVRQGGDKRYLREVTAWIHPNRSQSHDGIPGRQHSRNGLGSYAEPVIMRALDWGDDRAERLRRAVSDAPALFVLCTTSDSAAAWLDAGQALERVLLEATSAGLSASFLNAPVQLADLRPEVARAVDLENGHPHIILRMGYGGRLRATPRRPLNEVIASNRFT